MPRIRPVVLSGGSGTRLWPLSTAEIPKQFTPLFGDQSLFGLTLKRLDGLTNLRPPIVVTGRRHLDAVTAEIETGPVATAATIIEPIGRNTAPAAIAAALIASPDDVLVLLPSDHLISDVAGFREAVTTASSLAEAGGVVTFGVRPTRPETGYGYIEMGAPKGEAFEVARFKEKPDVSEAERLAGDGRHLWNSGMFVIRAHRLLEEAAELCPDILEGVRSALPSATDGLIELGASFQNVEAMSFDYAIMEKTTRALVLPIDVGWSDVGSYRSLFEMSDRDNDGNHLSGDVTVVDVTGSYLKSTSRQLVVAGLDNIIVVETPDAVLVIPLDRAQEVKELQARFDD
ncbi:MAG TPA: mannose-1-phosphate guanylyltransferase [Acidimicrobiia bacterium]|nr:mannose-1-phosphate guanylyltransferase [Acidimicrobiia bacterium]